MPSAAAAVCTLQEDKRTSARLNCATSNRSPADKKNKLTLGFAEVQGMVRHRHPESLSGVNVSSRVVVTVGVLLLGAVLGGGARTEEEEEEKKRTDPQHGEKPLLQVSVED